jgi:carboxymethylenebutenolidase
MGATITLTAADGHSLSAYRAEPAGAPRGGIVVVQEIFGVNHHIRSVCDRIAAQGYLAVAPAMFDRFSRGFEAGYEPDEILRVRGFALKNIEMDKLVLDAQAAQQEVKAAGKTGMVGFCMGGSVSFVSATRLDGLAAASCFYGGVIVKFADAKPKCPTQMHFGEFDQHIPMSDVESVKARRGGDCEIFVYPAGHGFYCDERASFHAPSAKQAWDRTLALFEQYVSAPS